MIIVYVTCKTQPLFFWHYKIFCVNGKYGIQNRVPYFLFYTFTK